MATPFDIPLCEPFLGGREQEYIADAIARNEIAQGDYLPRFEELVAAYVGVPHAIAVSSGTAALHLALITAGVKPGDEVILPALTFIAPANAVRYCGATPVFVDVEPDYWQMDTSTVSKARFVLPVHLLGHPVDMDWLTMPEFGAAPVVIEDATEAFGATYKGTAAGAMGDIACLSFNGNKLLTTGGGGMVLTSNADMAAKVRYLAAQARDSSTEYIHHSVGYNYRLSNVQAAIGCAQMERIDAHLAAKRRISATYREELADIPGITAMRQAPWATSAYWLSTITVNPAEYGRNARQLRARLTAARIQSRTIWQPLNLSGVFPGIHASCPVAEALWETALSLPSSVGLSEEDQYRVIETIQNSWKTHAKLSPKHLTPV